MNHHESYLTGPQPRSTGSAPKGVDKNWWNSVCFVARWKFTWWLGGHVDVSENMVCIYILYYILYIIYYILNIKYYIYINPKGLINQWILDPLVISIFCGSKDLSPSRKLQRTGQLGREKYPGPYPIRSVDKWKIGSPKYSYEMCHQKPKETRFLNPLR